MRDGGTGHSAREAATALGPFRALHDRRFIAGKLYRRPRPDRRSVNQSLFVNEEAAWEFLLWPPSPSSLYVE